MRVFAHIISVIFHPLLMCTYGSIIFFGLLKGTVYDPVFRSKLILVSMIFSFSFVLPVINVYILYRLNRISSYKLEAQSDRTFPYIMTACFYFGLFYLFIDLNIWMSMKALILGAGVAILLTALINLKYKISAHMVGVGGLLGSMIILSFFLNFKGIYIASGLILLSGLIATCRLYLNAHRPVQIYSGFFLGFFTQVVVFLIFVTLKFV